MKRRHHNKNKWRTFLMKIAISATGKVLESTMDQRFGRTACFIIVDPVTMEFEAIDNQAAASAGGAGIASAQTVVNKGVEAVITGNVGPNAMNVLKAVGIIIYQGAPVGIRENLEMYKRGVLQKIENAVPAHFGMGFSGGQE
jgi:predicted Fe-Mo cluster-binding NifX family protein